MADTTTELEVLNQIVDVLGGQSGQYETVVPVLEDIRDLLGGGGGGGGYNPSLSVGRADALTGADETSQWATRESTGTGSATVRSVQGAAVGWNQMVRGVGNDRTLDWGLSITASTGKLTLNGTNSSGSTKTASVVFSVAGPSSIINGHKYFLSTGQSMLATYVNLDGMWGPYSGPAIATAAADGTNSTNIIINVPNGTTLTDFVVIPQLFDLTAMFGSGNEPTVAEFEQMYPESYYPYSAPTLKPVQISGIRSTTAQGGELDSVEWTAQTLRAAGNVADVLYADHVDVRVGERAYQSGDESDATVRTDGTTTYYPLATPTTTPISPALPMTYRVQQGGSESIIVPDGEVSAAPIITVAEGESAADVVMDALACIAAPDGPVATSNHAINTYLTMGGKLYKVTSAIAVGETIAPNTNVSQTTVMAEILALN